MEFINFFLLLWVTFAFLDPDAIRFRIHNTGLWIIAFLVFQKSLVIY